jgi:hypothetical protein
MQRDGQFDHAEIRAQDGLRSARGL